MVIPDEKPRFRFGRLIVSRGWGQVWSRAKPGEVVEYDHRRVAARCARDAPSRVSAAPAEVQPSYGRPVAGPAGERPEGEQLIRRHVGLIDATAWEAPFPLHVERRDDLPCFDRMRYVRSEPGERVEDRVPDIFLAIVPVSVPESVRGVLRVDGQRDFARWREARIRHGVQDAVEERLLRMLAPLPIVPGPLEIVDGRTDVEVPSVVRLDGLARSGREI